MRHFRYPYSCPVCQAKFTEKSKSRILKYATTAVQIVYPDKDGKPISDDTQSRAENICICSKCETRIMPEYVIIPD